MYEFKRCVLIADDETRILRALTDLMNARGFHVITASNGREAIERFYENMNVVDIVLLDVMMPEADGYAVLRAIRSAAPRTPVIMLTAKGEEYDELQGFQAGADDYIAKPFSTTLLLARMEAVLRRSGIGGEKVLTAGGIVLIPEQQRVEVDGTRVELTRREFNLLFYFMRNEGLTLSREQLLNGVWGYDFEGDERTIDTHVKNLRLKLGPYSSYIHTVHRVGYRFEAET